MADYGLHILTDLENDADEKQSRLRFSVTLTAVIIAHLVLVFAAFKFLVPRLHEFQEIRQIKTTPEDVTWVDNSVGAPPVAETPQIDPREKSETNLVASAEQRLPFATGEHPEKDPESQIALPMRPPAPEPAPPMPEPEPEPEPAPAPIVKEEKKPEPKPVLLIEKKPEPKPDPKPDPAPEPKAEIKPVLTPPSKPKPKTSTVPKLTPAPAPKPAPKPVPVEKPKPKPAPVAVVKPAPKLTPAPIPAPKPTPTPAPALKPTLKPAIESPPKPSPAPNPAPAPAPKAVKPEVLPGEKPVPGPATAATPGPASANPNPGAPAAPAPAGPETDLSGYHSLIHDAFHKNWRQPKSLPQRTAAYQSKVKITIARDGTIIGTGVVKSSGNLMMDGSVLKAVQSVRQIAPLPNLIEGATYSVIINFQLD